MKTQALRRQKRKLKIRKHIYGTSNVPRISIFKSNKKFSAQAIVDENSNTIASVGTNENNIDGVSKVAVEFAKLLKKSNIEKVKFDRNGFRFHGKVKAFADKLRESGINF